MRSQQSPRGSSDGPDFRGQDLSGVNLGGRDLTNARMQGAILHGTIFNGVTSLDGADLTGAEIGFGADFTGCDLSNVTFGEKLSLVDSPYHLTRFVKATLPSQALGSHWNGLDLTGANIVGLGSVLRELTVSRTILGNGFNFAGCDLTKARFSGVLLRGADFRGATLQGAVFATTGDAACDLTGADFSGADLRGASIRGATLTGALFRKAVLQNATITGNAMTGADFTDAKPPGATITGNTPMNGCRFDNVDLASATNFSLPGGAQRDKKNLISFRGGTIKLRFLVGPGPLGTCWVPFDFSYLDLAGTKIVDLATQAYRDDTTKRVTLWGFQARYSVLTGMDFSDFDFIRVSPTTHTDCDPPNFTGATLTGVSFRNSVIPQAIMRGVQSRCELFCVAADSADGKALGVALRNGQVAKVSEIFTQHGITLSQATISNSPRGQWIVTGKPAQGSDQRGAIYEVTSQDAGKATATLIVADITPPVFDGAKLPDANFGPAGSDGNEPTVLRGARFNRAAMDRADFRYADLGKISTKKDEDNAAQFADASMVSAVLVWSVLSGAKLTHTTLAGANLTGASLDWADLTGAQLGAATEKFRIAGPVNDGPKPEEYQKFLTALRTPGAGTGATIAAILSSHGVPLTAGEATVETTVPDRLWAVRDSSGHSYTVLNWSSSDRATFLIVSGTAPAASLTGTYMANACLQNANLLGASATYVQLFGDKAKLDGAILDGCKLSGANLSGASFASVSLYNLDLSGANLIGTKFSNADLRKATLSQSNLQGADLADAQLAEANLIGAAVAFPLTAEPPVLAGTYLFTLDKATAAQVRPEIEAAGGLEWPMTLSEDAAAITRTIDGLRKSDIAALRELFEAQGKPLPPSAAVSWVGGEDGEAWRVTGGCDYSVWHVFITDATGSITDNQLLAGPSMPKLKAAFRPLRWQARVEKIGEGTPQMWQVFNDNDNPRNFQLGYDTLLAITDGESLTFYGTSLRVQELGSIDQATIKPVPLIATKFGQPKPPPDGPGSCIQLNTKCPNGLTLDENNRFSPRTSWEKMLRAKEPPAPPTCVPGPYADCPPVKKAILEAEEARLRGEGLPRELT